MTYLASRFESSMKALAVTEIKPSTKKHLRRRVESELAESIHIIPDDNGRLLL